MIEARSGFSRPFLLFASEPASRLAEPWLAAECRLFAHARPEEGARFPLVMNGTVGEALSRLQDTEAVRIELEVRQGVAVLAGKHSLPQVIPGWAGASISSILKALEPPPMKPQQPALLGGVVVKQSVALRGRDGAVLSAESVPVKLWLKRRCRILRLPSHSAVRDLRAAATAALGLQPNGAVKAILRIRKGRVVEDEEDPKSLEAYCMDNGDCFTAEKPPPGQPVIEVSRNLSYGVRSECLLRRHTRVQSTIFQKCNFLSSQKS